MKCKDDSACYCVTSLVTDQLHSNVVRVKCVKTAVQSRSGWLFYHHSFLIQIAGAFTLVEEPFQHGSWHELCALWSATQESADPRAATQAFWHTFLSSVQTASNTKVGSCIDLDSFSYETLSEVDVMQLVVWIGHEVWCICCDRRSPSCFLLINGACALCFLCQPFDTSAWGAGLRWWVVQAIPLQPLLIQYRKTGEKNSSVW